MNIIIRQITSSDFPQAIEVIKKTIRFSFGKIYPKELIDSFCTKYTPETMSDRMMETIFFVAEDNDSKKISGIIGLQGNRLRTFYVDPDYQGKGVGSLLYKALEQKAKDLHFTKLILEGSPLGQPVYEHFGYKKLKTVDKERAGIKFQDAYMEKNLI